MQHMDGHRALIYSLIRENQLTLGLGDSKKDGNVGVYLMQNAAQISGLAVLASDAKEITVVNIIGNVDLDKLSQLEGHFSIPDLGIEVKPKRKN